jgi:hypothetical protein
VLTAWQRSDSAELLWAPAAREATAPTRPTIAAMTTMHAETAWLPRAATLAFHWQEATTGRPAAPPPPHVAACGAEGACAPAAEK